MAYKSASSYCKLENKACAQWVYTHMKDCMCNKRDIFSFALGLLSLVCWVVSVIPQMVTNYKTRSCNGVSIPFLFAWLTGDAFNLAGCLLEPATLPFQLYTAVIFVTATLTLMTQALYYRWWKIGRPSPNSSNHENVEAAISQNNAIPRIASYGAAFIGLSSIIKMPRQAEALMSSTNIEHSNTAQWLGWFMSAIYITARLPQIRLNGLNPFMFICAIVANFITVGSIVLRTTRWDKIKPNLPWLFDAVGCTVMDLFTPEMDSRSLSNGIYAIRIGDMISSSQTISWVLSSSTFLLLEDYIALASRTLIGTCGLEGQLAVSD